MMQVILADLLHHGFGSLCQPALDGGMVEIKVRLGSKIEHAASHPCADPGTRIAQHYHASSRHVFTQEPFDICARADEPEAVIERPGDLPADDDIRTRQAD